MFDKIKDVYAFAKGNLNRSRYIYNYFVLPIFSVLGFIDLVIVFILMLLSSKFLVPCLILFGIFLLALGAILCVLPFIRKKEIEEEVVRINCFFESNLEKNPEHEYVLPKSTNDGTLSLTFTKSGFVLDGKTMPYSSFDAALFTSNYMYHANLIIVFSRNNLTDEEKADENVLTSFSLPLDVNTLTLMDIYDIKLVNSDVLAFIKDNPKEAARQILKYGKIQKNYDKYKTR